MIYKCGAVENALLENFVPMTASGLLG